MITNSHLSDGEFAELLGGSASQTVLAHLQVCAECSVEAHDLREAIGGFRNLLTASTLAPAWQRSDQAAAPAVHRWGLRLAGALAILLMVSGGILLDRNSATRPQILTSASVSDAELLDQVQAQLTSDAPAALEPVDYLAEERQEILQSTQRQRANQRR